MIHHSRSKCRIVCWWSLFKKTAN